MKGNNCNPGQEHGNWNGYSSSSKHRSSTSDSSGDCIPTERISSSETCGEVDRDTPQHLEPFQPTSYLERQVEKLGLDDEHEAMGLVTDQLRERHKRAERKREEHVKRIVDSNAEKVKRVGNINASVKDKEEKKKNSIRSRHVRKLDMAQRRRRRSLDTIIRSRKRYHREVERKRNDSVDLSLSLSAKSLSSLECKLSMADRRRQEMKAARKRRSQECHNGAKAQFAANDRASFMGLCDTIANGGGDHDVGCLSCRFHDGNSFDSMHKRSKSVSIVLSRLKTKARATRTSALTKRLWGARVIQEWWRCMVDGVAYEGINDQLDMESSLPFSFPGCCSSMSSVSSNISLKSLYSLGETEDSSKETADSSVDTLQSFGMSLPSLEGGQMNKYYSEDIAARTIQRFFRQCRHYLKVVCGLVNNVPSIKYVCGKIREMETASFDEGMEIMKDKDLIKHMENTLRALRMGREVRHIPSGVRSSRAFMCSMLINSYPTSSLDDNGAMSSGHSTNNKDLELKKEKLVESSGEVILGLFFLEGAVNKAVKMRKNDYDDDDDAKRDVGRRGVTASATRLILNASKKVTATRLIFCKRLDSWKRLDGIRLTDEMTSACVDILLMQLRAERDLRVAAARLGLEDAMIDENNLEDAPLLNVGFRQIKEGTQRQLGRMFAALVHLVGREEARLRMVQATEAAFRRLQIDDIESDGGGDPDGNLVTSRNRNGTPESRGTMTDMSVGSNFYDTEDDDVDGSERKAGVTHALTAGDILSNEWLVHEVLVSEKAVTVNLEQAEEKGLLEHSSGSLVMDDSFWEQAAEAFKAHDYAPLIMLISDLRVKIIGLTPKRNDLAIETCDAMDVDLLKQMNDHGALGVNTFFKVIRFAGERVLELEAPIRNRETSAKLEALSEAQSSITIGMRVLDIDLVREYFTFLFNKLGEIHVDILNAHLQFIVPFLKQHGVEYEKDRFLERLDSNEINLDVTYSWLHQAIRSLRDKSSYLSEERDDPNKVKEAEDAQRILDGVEAEQGDAYLKVVRMAVVDYLLEPMVYMNRDSPVTRDGNKGKLSPITVSSSSKGEQLSCSKRKRMEEFIKADKCHHPDGGILIPETFRLDRYVTLEFMPLTCYI